MAQTHCGSLDTVSRPYFKFQSGKTKAEDGQGSLNLQALKTISDDHKRKYIMQEKFMHYANKKRRKHIAIITTNQHRIKQNFTSMKMSISNKLILFFFVLARKQFYRSCWEIIKKNKKPTIRWD